jgi:hypothetical protein
MQPLRWERRPDGLRAPALVCAFKGWNDAGESATSALSFIASSFGAEAFASIDPEEFVDFQSTRPMVRLEDGVTRTIDWPEFEIHAVRIPIAKVNIDENPSTPNRFFVRGIPTWLLFKDGDLKETIVGLANKDDLVRVIDKHLTEQARASST